MLPTVTALPDRSRRPQRLLLWAAMSALVIGGRVLDIRAEGSTELQITLQTQQHLVPNAHTAIAVLVQLPAASKDLPLLLTPRIEGAAVELVRGRLLRSDAKQTDATHLRFEVPVVARSEGTAILRISASSYLCEDTCRRLEATTSAVLEVR